MNRVLITGGAGFIGSHLANRLIKSGYQVSFLDCLLPKVHGKSPRKNSATLLSLDIGIREIIGSVTSQNDLEESIKNQDIIIHLASETGTGESMYETSTYANVNVGGTALLLDILINTKHSVKKVILASSRAVYGEGKYLCENLGEVYPTSRCSETLSRGEFEVSYPGCADLEFLPSDENSRLNPISVYGITKQNQEQLVSTVCKSIGIDWVIFRYQNVYGPGQSLSNPYTGIVSVFTSLIRNNQDLTVFEDGRGTRDFVYIDDVVNGTILGLENSEAAGQIFNIGSGESTRIIDIAKLLKEYFASDISINVNGKYRMGDIRHSLADLSLAKKVLGFKPEKSFKDGLRDFVDWASKIEKTESAFESSLSILESKGLFS